MSASANQTYEQRLVALPKPDWQPGDPPEEWPHGFVGVTSIGGLRCGVWISDQIRCARFEHHPIHDASYADKRASPQ